MIAERCPEPDELLTFVDADLPPEQLSRIERHLELCSACTQRVLALSELVEDVAAPLPGGRLDVAAHVAGVMKRLDEPAQLQSAPRWATWAAAALAAAAVVLAFVTRTEQQPTAERFAARGAEAKPSLARDVGVQLYTQTSVLAPLAAGSHIAGATALTAGVRNVTSGKVYLLLFAVDAKREVHWLAPAYTQAGTDPKAVEIAAAPGEQLLGSAAVFDDLALGRIEIMALVSAGAMRVSEIEALSASDLDERALSKRFPSASVRRTSLEVVAEGRP